MTVAGFQQALADLVAGPELCRQVRAGADVAAVLPGCDLDDRERERLVAMVRDSGMTANCAVYRSNRLTPLVLNLPGTYSALGSDLHEVLDRFWAECPTERFDHFLIEAERFVSSWRRGCARSCHRQPGSPWRGRGAGAATSGVDSDCVLSDVRARVSSRAHMVCVARRRRPDRSVLVSPV